MPEKVKPIPDEYRGATPYLCVKGGVSAIDFYKKAFGAREMMRIPMDDKIGHAELRIGDALFMLADEFPEMNFRSPQSLGGTPVNIVIYVEDVDSLVRQAESAGAKVLRPPADQFYGDRMARLEDPFGHSWSFATHVEDVSPEELEERAAARQR
ncbi:MAG TPA: VOC family protein [Candidatus Binatia bacterium]